MTTRDEARERLAAALLGQPDLIISGGVCLCTVRRDDLQAILSDQPRPSVSEDQGSDQPRPSVSPNGHPEQGD
jgi:hypothetical protein